MLSAIKKLLGFGGASKVLKEIKSGNDTLSVVDNGDEISLKLNNVVYSRLKKGKVYTGSYWDYFSPLPVLYKKPNILMIGLGGGTIAYQLTKLYRNVNLDIVEISKPMIELSDYFLPKKLKNVRIIQEDGLKYIKKKLNAYDLLILDAYDGDHIPEDFLNDEFVADAYKTLRKEGILAINYALNLSALVYLENYLNKLRKLFKVYTINNPFTSGNMIIIGSKEMNRDDILRLVRLGYKENKDNKSVMLGYREMA